MLDQLRPGLLVGVEPTRCEGVVDVAMPGRDAGTPSGVIGFALDAITLEIEVGKPLAQVVLIDFKLTASPGSS